MSLTVGKFTVKWVGFNEHMHAFLKDKMVLNTLTNRKAPSLTEEEYNELMEYFNANRKQYVFN